MREPNESLESSLYQKKLPLNATMETPNIILRAILCSIQNNGKEMISILPHIIIQNDHRDHKNIYIIQSGRPEINYTLTPFLQETSDSETSPQVSMVGVAIASQLVVAQLGWCLSMKGDKTQVRTYSYLQPRLELQSLRHGGDGVRHAGAPR